MHRTMVILVGVLVAAVAFGAGFATGGYWGKGSGPGSPSAQRSATLSISAAGTLGVFFPQVADALANTTPGISVPSASQTYEGSLLALSAVRTGAGGIDVAASADYRLIPQLLEPTHASWEAVFATTPEVLAYDPSATALDGINSTNWASKIERPGVLLGVANASTDPNGYNGIFVLELEGLVSNGSLSSVYSHFYTTPVGAYGVPSSATTRVEPEAQAATLLASHTVQAFIIYRSFAVTHHLTFVDLDPSVNLGSLSPDAITFDARASTSILSSSGATELVTGAPVAFAATVPTSANNASLGEAFIAFLLSPAGATLATSDGFSPVFPGWSDHPSAAPPALQPFLIPLPPNLPIG